MRRFIASAWFPFLTAVVLAGVTVGAFAALKPLDNDVNAELLRAFQIAGWAAGPVMGLLSLILMMLLNGIRRMVKLRSVQLLHLVVALCGTLPWLVWSWSLTGEPRYTAFAIVVIDFVARPMLWGSLVSSIVVILLWGLSLLSRAPSSK